MKKIRILLIVVYLISEIADRSARAMEHNAFNGDLCGITGAAQLELPYSISEIVETRRI